MRVLILLLAASVSVMAQAPEVTISQSPPPTGYQLIYGYTGANLIYICYARSHQFQQSAQISISAASNASAAVLTSASHGFDTHSRPNITISGGTGNWTAINGTFVATIVNANTFSIPVDSTTFGALTGTIRFTTFAPRTNQQMWAVKQFSYDTSNNLVWSGWLNGSSAVTAAKCSDATSTSTNSQ